jgi:hypothetical protein
MTANIYTHMDKEDAASSIAQLENYLSDGSQETGKNPESSQKVVNEGI